MAKPRNADLPRSAAGPNSPWLIAVIVSIATFMEVLDTTIANVALRHIAGGLAASEDEATWVLTSYLVSNAIVLPISGWVSNVVGRKRFYMTCVAIFTVSSVLCGFATSLGFMIVCRIVQGIGGGGLAPTEQSIFADSFTPAMRSQAFALYGLTVVVAPAVGPVLGGYLTDDYSWHWVFLINLPIGLLSLTLTHFFVYEPKALRDDRRKLLAGGLKVDYVGFALVVLGFGSLQIVLDRFQRDDGFSSTFIACLATVCFVSLAALVVWEIVHRQPVVNVRLLAIPSFAISCAVMFVIGFMLISTTQLLPQFSQELMGYDAITAGQTLSLGGILTVVLMPASGVISGLIQPKWLLFGALAMTAFSLYHLTGLDATASFWTLADDRMLQVVALPFLFIPITAASYNGIPPDKTNEASAIINLMRNLGGSVGVSFTTTLLQRRDQFHHERLAEHVTRFTDLHGQSLAQMGQAVETQASVLSYIDVFYTLAVIAALVTPMVLFLRNVPKERAPVAIERVILLTGALLLTGCTLGPDFKRPTPAAPESWLTGHPAAAHSVTVAEPVDPAWWSLFHDAELTRLVNLVAEQNLDVRIATIQLVESRAQRASTASGLFPLLNGNASYTREKPSAKGIFSAFGSGPPSSFASGAGAGTAANGAGTSSGPGGVSGASIAPLDLYQAGFDASWELDLWGRVRRSVESADAGIDTSAEARRGTLLNSLAELVRDYVQLRGVQADIAIIRDNIATAEETLRLTQSRASSGLTPVLDVTTARAQVSSTEAGLPALEQQETSLINALGTLLGQPPGALLGELSATAPVPPVPPRVPVGLPSELARRRPDIREAEARLHGATADIGVAVASFFPTVTLSGSVGVQALQPKNLFTTAAGQYAFGPSLTVPIFEGGKLRATLALRKAQQREAAVAYQKVVLQALQEVDNALSAYADEQRRHDSLTATARDSQTALELSRQLYGRGLADFLKVLDAQRNLLSARQQLADSGTMLSTNLVALYKALGGGWETGFPVETAAR